MEKERRKEKGVREGHRGRGCKNVKLWAREVVSPPHGRQILGDGPAISDVKFDDDRQ